MGSENIKNNDPLQLQQMIVFLKAELAKYKYAVKKYQNGYHYSLITKLELENTQLANEKNELSEELYRLNRELIKRTSDYKERSQLHEIQNKKQRTSIINLQKTTTDLTTTNLQLTEAIHQLKDGLSTNHQRNRPLSSLHNKIIKNKMTMEQFEHKLVDVIQEENKQLHAKIDSLDMINQKLVQTDKVKQHLLQEIEQKNNMIGKLQHELSHLKEKNEHQTNTATIDTEILMQLDHQIKELLAQSLAFEEKLVAKLLVLNALEHELDQLTIEIHEFTVLSPLLKKF